MELILTLTKTENVKAKDISEILVALEKAHFKVEAIPTYFKPKAIKITK